MIIPTSALLLSVLAHAQTFDAAGMVIPPSSDVADPILGFGGAPAGGPALSLMGEGASNPLVRQLDDGEQQILDPIVGSLFGINVGGSIPLGRRVDLDLSAPLWLATDGASAGSALGDVHLWVPIRLIDQGPVDLAVVPFGRLPTGPDSRFLGDPAGAGAIASFGSGLGPWFVHTDLGLDVGGPSNAEDWPGSVRSRFAFDTGLKFGPVGLHAEVRTRAPLGASIPSAPSEAVLAIRGKGTDRIGLSLGGGRAITRGVGAGSLRLFMGASVLLGADPTDPEEFVAPEKEIREVNVIDAMRLPIRGATITAGTTEVLSDFEGFADLPIKSVKAGELTVTAPGYLPVTRSISVDDRYWEVQLKRAPVPVAVSVVGPEGEFLDAKITILGDTDVGDGAFDEAGVEHWDLPQGTWAVAIDAPGYGSQTRTLIIDDRRIDPIRVDAILMPASLDATSLEVRVVDALGRPVEDAVVAVENRDLGTTGSGGDLQVGGLEKGEHAIVVRSSRFGPAVVKEVNLKPDENNVITVPLQWQPGSVLVRVAGPNGTPTDAEVTFTGPEALPERALGTDGEEMFVLGPGEWEVSIESPTLTPQKRTISVTETPGQVITLDLALLPEEGGDADLDLVVVDPDGWPVEGLDIALDGKPVGKTGPNGTVNLVDLQRGVRFIQLGGSLIVPRLTEVDLVGDHQVEQVVVWWVDGVVDLTVTNAEGIPVDAKLSPLGPSEYPPFDLGPDGFERRVFPPGGWAFGVEADELAPRATFLTVEAGTHRRQKATFRLEPPAPAYGKLTVRIEDPEGNAPARATVKLNGEDAGEATNGFFQMEGVPTGPLEIEVDAVGLAPLTESIEIEPETERTLTGTWAPGTVRVIARTAEGPVDAVLKATGAGAPTTLEITGGTQVLELAPGAWTLSASFADLGTETKDVVLSRAPALKEVIFDLAAEVPVARLEVLTPTKQPLADAVVTVDGKEVGKTDSAGKLTFETQPAAASELQIAPADASLAPITMTLPPQKGEQEHALVVPYAPREVEVAVAGVDGAPVGLTNLEAFGDGEKTGTATDGSGSLDLAPGTWTVTGRTESGEVGTARVVVPADRTEPAKVELVVEAVATTADGDVLKPESPILFDLGASALRPDSEPILDDIARWLLADRTVALVEVAGHTDDIGGVTYNQELSEKRAEAVRAALARRGVARERLTARGYGLSRPVSSGTDEASRQGNRRVELKVLRAAGE